MNKTDSKIKTTSATDLKTVKESESKLNRVLFCDKKLSRHLCNELFVIKQNISLALKENKSKTKLHSRGRKEKQKQEEDEKRELEQAALIASCVDTTSIF